jgi:enoyl-CoA hydratase
VSAELSFLGHVAVLRLNRPQALNALNADMVAQIGLRLDELAASDARALVIVGEGSKAFSAGADVKELEKQSADALRATARRGQLTFAKLDSLGIPSVAVIHGVAFGGGLELAMACTFRIASAGARFGLPEIKLGLIPAYGGTQRLPRLVGTARAVEMIATGRAIGGEEAERIGLVHRLVEIGDPVDAGLRFLSEMGSPFPAALANALNATTCANALPIDLGLGLEAELFAVVSQTKDAREGMRAFIEKRPSVFVGQ